MSGVSGLLFHQLNEIQTENSELKNELVEVNTLLEEEQNTSLNLETQITQLQNHLEQLEQSLVEVETQRNELEDQLSNATDRVKITDFTMNGTTFPVVGVGWDSDFFITVENFGINDVENLKVVFNLQLINLDSREIYNFSIGIDTLKAGESKIIQFRKNHNYYTNPIIATLMKDEIILDKQAETWKV